LGETFLAAETAAVPESVEMIQDSAESLGEMNKDEFLKYTVLTRNLPVEERSFLATLLVPKKFSADAVIVRADEKAHDLMLLVFGKVKIVLTGKDGKEAIITQLGQGDYFGEIALLTGEDRSADVVTLEDTSLLLLSKNDFDRNISKLPHFIHELAQALARRLALSTEKIGDLALLDVYRRVARTLASLAAPADYQGKKAAIVRDRPTHKDLAAMTGTSREMVTRALKDLERDECIVIDGKDIYVLDTPS
jgi:CRP/FNR family cyclic AMP-dependent transcriptional regulator